MVSVECCARTYPQHLQVTVALSRCQVLLYNFSWPGWSGSPHHQRTFVDSNLIWKGGFPDLRNLDPGLTEPKCTVCWDSGCYIPVYQCRLPRLCSSFSEWSSNRRRAARPRMVHARLSLTRLPIGMPSLDGNKPKTWVALQGDPSLPTMTR